MYGLVVKLTVVRRTREKMVAILKASAAERPFCKRQRMRPEPRAAGAGEPDAVTPQMNAPHPPKWDECGALSSQERRVGDQAISCAGRTRPDFRRARAPILPWLRKTCRHAPTLPTVNTEPALDAVMRHTACGDPQPARRPPTTAPSCQCDCLCRFSVLEWGDVRAAQPTAVEAFSLRSSQAWLPPAKGGARFSEGVLQSRTPTKHSLVPRTPSQ